MDLVEWITRPEGLRDPVLVCAFRGWNDAGESATAALAVLVGSLGAAHVATVPGEEIYDYQATRPTVSIDHGELRGIEWPDVEVWAARPEGAPRDLLLVAGAEPSYRWRTFCRSILDAAEGLGVRRVVTLGALLADVPHTRPTRLGGLAAPASLIEGKGYRPPTYEGPTGIVGVLHGLASERGLEAASVWASVPHYLGALRSAPCALALVRATEGLTGVAVDASELEQAVGEYETQVTSAVERDSALQQLVTRLEQEVDRMPLGEDHGDLPTGDALARDFERYLRQREEPS
ncbi:MAG: PAC2 family protein [Actinomycetota bacterium]